MLGLLGLSGCASAPDRSAIDPWEPANRAIDGFNQDFDKAFAKPVAKGYRYVMPDPLDQGVTNFFDNLADINSAFNNLLQFKPGRAISDVGRVGINSTVGLLGFIDVASRMGLKSYKEDFGQTLGTWGVGDEPYFVVPLTGPNTVRDFTGEFVDLLINPIYYTTQGVYWSLLVVKYIDTRAGLIETTDFLQEAAVDPYVFARESYLQARKQKVMDTEGQIIDRPEIDKDFQFEDEEPGSESTKPEDASSPALQPAGE